MTEVLNTSVTSQKNYPFSKMRYLQIAVLFSFFSCAVNTENSQFDPLKDFERQELLRSKRMVASDSIFKTNDLLMTGKYLIVHDPDLQYIFKIIDVSKDEFLFSFGRRGEGPCELGPLSFINRFGPEGQFLGIYNGSSRTYLEFLFQDIIDLNGDLDCIETKFNLEKYHLSIAKIRSKLAIGYALDDQPYSLITDGKSVNKLGSFPFQDEFPKVPREVLAMAYQNRLIKHPTESKLISTSRFSFNMDFLSWDNSGNLEIYKSLHFWPTEFLYEETAGEFAAPITSENRFGNLSTTVSKRFIYVLYNDEPWNYQFPQKSKKILVYDWAGSSIKIYELDQELSHIAVHENDEYLIGYYDDGKANLYKFDLE
ncbi:TolB-like 6-bladed beta-propeller domain-containing protein [Algoriphagus sp. oki45]|uniref:BF3164 family lipoprotein n=1 Tax=Algoriphagus sp. oki45 TaxID=3067294 RepID=UPI0027EB697E|nr:TolB-like 6-bladed beta-propeller domain-containing protein [Algoriphagus sp. oki45]